jgi:cobalt-precorrin 5A hydrolase
MLSAGFGFRRGCSADDLRAVLVAALAQSGRALEEVASLVAPEWKRDEAGLRELARTLQKPLLLLPLASLRAHAPAALTRSEESLRRYQLPSIAETAALAGALAFGDEHAASIGADTTRAQTSDPARHIARRPAAVSGETTSCETGKLDAAVSGERLSMGHSAPSSERSAPTPRLLAPRSVRGPATCALAFLPTPREVP